MDGSLSAISSWLKSWFADAGDAEKETMIQGLYGLWSARNEARDGKRIADAKVIADTVYIHMVEWRVVHDKVAAPAQPKQAEKWKPPVPGWIKVNADGAMAKAKDKGGGGVVLRDHDGAFRGGAAVFFPTITNPELAEILATGRAVQMVVQLDAQRVHVELDSKGVVTMLNERTMDRSASGPYIEDIKEMLRTRQEYKVTCARRTSNAAAHILAKEGVSNESDFMWHEMPPDCILHIVAGEIPDFS